MTRSLARNRRAEATALPGWIKPQLTKLVDQPPEGPEWLHEIKFDGYRMHASLDRGAVCLLTRTGLDWTYKYPAIATAVASLGASQAYLDGELCGVGPDGLTSFSMIQLASDAGNAAGLMFFLFDLLYLDGDNVSARPLQERKARLAVLLKNELAPAIQRSPGRTRPRLLREGMCTVGRGHRVEARRCPLHARQPRSVGKVKCLYREEFVVVGWTDPEGARPWLGALLLAYYDAGGGLVYAGRVGTGIGHSELERLWRRLQPLAMSKMPFDVSPPRASRFGAPAA
jgi:ATP-dependent DNA ligase